MRGAHRVDVVALHEADVPQHVLFGDGPAAPAVELVAVDAAEHEALAVELEDAVLDGHMPEADASASGLQDLAVRVEQSDGQLVQVGAFGAPWRRVIDLGLGVQRSVRFRGGAPDDGAVLVPQCEVGRRGVRGTVDQHIQRERTP